MAIKITQEEAAKLSQFAYMNLDSEVFGWFRDNPGFSLKDMALQLLQDRDKVIKEGKEPRGFDGWGAFTSYEQYQMLEDIASGKYENLSNLKIADYENQQGTTDFAAYAFSDGTNTVCAFRGTMGTQVGNDGTVATIKGFLGPSWLDNGYLGTQAAYSRILD